MGRNRNGRRRPSRALDTPDPIRYRRPMVVSGGPSLSWSALADLIRLRNQTGSLLLLFPTLWALVLASDGHPPLALTAIFTVGVFIMRSAGVTINDWWDRDLDRQVQRTRERPIASGRLQPHAALGVFIVLIGMAAGLVLLLNPLTIALAPTALFLAVLYPLAKRVMPLPQAVLGLAFGWGAVMAWAAVRNEIGWPALGLFAATICWAVGYDTIYALQDVEDDRRIGVRSSAIFFGDRCWIAVGGALLAMTVILALIGAATHLGPSFYLSLLLAAGLFAAQARRIRRGLSQAHAFALFKQHVGIGALILAGIWSGVLLR
ncbi:MAG: 4-hydroxybenzoate octaprenyltransferase [Nitrospirae bacterium]|nr:MAG: 4-hydroxybenzoate octaprenyltransferase [Nitrospirota bacterium]